MYSLIPREKLLLLLFFPLSLFVPAGKNHLAAISKLIAVAAARDGFFVVHARIYPPPPLFFLLGYRVSEESVERSLFHCFIVRKFVSTQRRAFFKIEGSFYEGLYILEQGKNCIQRTITYE